MQELTVLEFFAGEGHVWKAMRADAISAVGVDIGYVEPEPGNQNPFDILSNAGFGWGPELFCTVFFEFQFCVDAHAHANTWA